MRMAVAAADPHNRDSTRTAVVQVGWCVEENVDVPVSQSAEQILDDPMSQVVADTVVEQIVHVPVLDFQQGVAEQVVDFSPRGSSFYSS